MLARLLIELNDQALLEKSSWRQSRYGFAAFWFASLVIAWFLLRAVLFAVFKPAGTSFGDVVQLFLTGFHRDLVVGLLSVIPLLFWFWIVPESSFGKKWHRMLFLLASFLILFSQIFLLFVEFFFFEEFKSRFNTVAVDYLYYPHEVFVNIWESYHVGPFLFVCLVLTLGWLVAAHKLFRRMWDIPFSARSRFLSLTVAALLAAVLAFSGIISLHFRRPSGLNGRAGLLIPSVEFKRPRVSNDRALNEIANNGTLSFFTAALTHHLDYSAFYKTLPREEAYARTRRLLREAHTEFVAEGDTIRRRVAGDPDKPKLNVVILLEESLGSEFWGCLGRTNSLTPEMDRLAAEEGMLFTNIYANGNRTVRGMEGVLSSFPSLPGDSIVKRDRSDNVETLARVLKRDGYSTLFAYGGRGVFDGMRSFTTRNGFDRFIEQKHFLHPTFTTVWGVCD